MWSPAKLLKFHDYDISKWEKVVAIDPKKLHIINPVKHFFRIVLIFSLTRTDCLCYDNAQPPSVKSKFDQLLSPLHLLTRALANCDLGAGESLEKNLCRAIQKCEPGFQNWTNSKSPDLSLLCFFFN